MNIKIIFPLDQAKVDNQEQALDAMSKGLDRLIENGALRGPVDDILLDYKFEEDSGYAVAELKEDALKDAAKLNEVGAGESLYTAPLFTLNDNTDEEVLKTFSIASIQERMRIQQRQPKIRLRYIVMDYKRFWQSKKSQIEKNPQMATDLKRMFLSDMNMLMTEVLPFIEEGKQLSMLVGTNQVDPSISKIARELSLIYRRTLKVMKTQNQIPRNMWTKLTPKYAEFMNHLLLKVFPGIDKIIDGNKETEDDTKSNALNTLKNTSKAASKMYSRASDGRIQLFSDANPTPIKVFSDDLAYKVWKSRMKGEVHLVIAYEYGGNNDKQIIKYAIVNDFDYSHKYYSSERDLEDFLEDKLKQSYSSSELSRIKFEVLHFSNIDGCIKFLSDNDAPKYDISRNKVINYSDANPTPEQEGVIEYLKGWVEEHPSEAKYLVELGIKWGADNLIEGLNYDAEGDNLK